MHTDGSRKSQRSALSVGMGGPKYVRAVGFSEPTLQTARSRSSGAMAEREPLFCLPFLVFLAFLPLPESFARSPSTAQPPRVWRPAAVSGRLTVCLPDLTRRVAVSAPAELPPCIPVT